MPNYDVQASLQMPSGLPQDQVVNVLHFDINAPDTVEGTLDDIAAAYTGLAINLSTDVRSLTLKAYAAGRNPGGPDVAKTYPVTGQASASPPQLAVCLSYATVDDPEKSVPRGRGRIYLGPISGSAMSYDRPPNGIVASALDFGAALAAAGNAGNTTWLMYSQRDNSYRKIESIWVDDTWDVQRRRGLSPTRRTVRDVQ
jgi:hypothetical protein